MSRQLYYIICSLYKSKYSYMILLLSKCKITSLKQYLSQHVIEIFLKKHVIL